MEGVLVLHVPHMADSAGWLGWGCQEPQQAQILLAGTFLGWGVGDFQLKDCF